MFIGAVRHSFRVWILEVDLAIGQRWEQIGLSCKNDNIRFLTQLRYFRRQRDLKRPDVALGFWL